MLDDDVLPYHLAITSLHNKHLKNPNVVVGKWGRNPGKNNEYNINNVWGSSAIVLTKFMMFDKKLAENFFEFSELLGELPKWGKPLWNGEDIFLSLVASKLSDKPNLAFPLLPVRSLRRGWQLSSHWGWVRKIRWYGLCYSGRLPISHPVTTGLGSSGRAAAWPPMIRRHRGDKAP